MDKREAALIAKEAGEKVYPWVSHGEWKSRIMEEDPLFNRTTYYFYNQYDQTQRIHEVWHDFGRMAEQNKAAYAATDERAKWGGDDALGTHFATVPLSIMHDVLKKTNAGKDRKAISKWIKDPVNRVFLRRPVRLGI